MRLSITLGSSPESWLGHQAAYDLWQAEQHLNDLHATPLLAAARMDWKSIGTRYSR